MQIDLNLEEKDVQSFCNKRTANWNYIDIPTVGLEKSTYSQKHIL